MGSLENRLFQRPPNEASSGDFRSTLGSMRGRGQKYDKRPSVAETFESLRKIMSILPEPARQEIGRDIANINKDPAAVVELIRSKIEAYRHIIDLLDNPISTDEALAELNKLVPPKSENIH
jgi:hypothetical protein